ncbi:hypothetical protein OG338_14620 [Streptomyces sp. NBC_00726]|uniref:hypothetical protein n=1 Tax=Streptomyces sp. NBC_00726 TaxID=2903674 RepID=UPI003867D336
MAGARIVDEALLDRAPPTAPAALVPAVPATATPSTAATVGTSTAAATALGRPSGCRTAFVRGLVAVRAGR